MNESARSVANRYYNIRGPVYGRQIDRSGGYRGGGRGDPPRVLQTES